MFRKGAMTDDTSLTALAERVEALLRERLGRRVLELHVAILDGGIILRGRSVTYHAKQLAQHVTMKEVKRPILANEIEVVGDSQGTDCW
jgi:hypothetical protein